VISALFIVQHRANLGAKHSYRLVDKL
jgi:hypothetical protein